MLFSGAICAQPPSDVFTWLESKTPGQGTIKIKQDPDIRNMMNLHLAQQEKMNGIYGYKICIYRGQTRKDAELARAKFISRDENVKCELQFDYPNWRVYVGAFRTKSEALQFLEKISNDYPDELFIRDGIVAFPD